MFNKIKQKTTVSMIYGIEESYSYFKYRKTLYKVKNYLNYKDQVFLCTMVLNEFLKDVENLSQIKLIEARAYFESLVVGLTSNLVITTLDESFTKTKLITRILNNIYNLEETWQLIIKSIDYIVFNDVFGTLKESIPNPEKYNNEMENSVELLKRLVEENPDVFKSIISNSINDSIKSSAKKEVTQEFNKAKEI